MREHIMVDLETLGLKSDAVILSIGAVKFNEKGLVIYYLIIST